MRRMIALKAFSLTTGPVKPGDEFEVPERDAEGLRLVGLARDADQIYMTRDLVAKRRGRPPKMQKGIAH